MIPPAKPGYLAYGGITLQLIRQRPCCDCGTVIERATPRTLRCKDCGAKRRTARRAERQYRQWKIARRMGEAISEMRGLRKPGPSNPNGYPPGGRGNEADTHGSSEVD